MKLIHQYFNFNRSILVYVFFYFTSFVPGTAQDFGRFKANIRWQQMNTGSARIIFPKGLETQASRVASNLDYLNRNTWSSIGPSSKKLDLILNNQGILSNGYVALMPFRSEFFTNPMQDGFALGTSSWLDLLSVHEYRHAQQYMNLRQSFTRIAWWLFGDAGWGSAMNLTTPGWFFEGDAVAMETALTSQGRGRMPSFLQQYKSLLLSDKNYSYMKARNGSYRDRIPGDYELGYLLCSYGRDNYGNDLWRKVIRQTAAMKGIIYPFSEALKRYTDLGTRKFYKKAMSDFKDNWTGELRQTRISPLTIISRQSKTVTDYRFPTYQNNGDLLVYKQSFRESGAIYRISPEGHEVKVCATGLTVDPYFTSSGNQITWAEITWDERYSSMNYSDVVIYQADKSKKIYLTRKQRYFSPALSPDGTQIAVVHTDSASRCQLKILNSLTGAVIQTLPNHENLYYTYPKWDTDGSSIISPVRTSTGSMKIIKQLISTGELSSLSGEYFQIIGEVMVTSDAILFASGFTGINNIYSLSRKDGNIRQLTGSRYGAYYPAISADGKQLVYSDFNIRGYTLVSASTDSLLWTTVNPVPQDKIKLYDFNYFKEEGGNIFNKIPVLEFESAPYQKLRHSLRIHTWNFSPDFYSAGINIISDNILNTLHLEGGLKYYYNEGAAGIHAKVQYGGLYPILTIGISRYYRHNDFLNVITGDESAQPVSVDDALSLAVRLPLNFTKGEYYRKADFTLGYSYISVRDLTGVNPDNGIASIVSAVSTEVQLSSVRKKAYQNITTPFGISLELSASQSIGFTRASRYQAVGDFAVRGLMANHNLVISAGWKHEPYLNSYHFIDLFLYPRGFSIPKADWTLTFQNTYHMPLVYPDFGFWGIFYCSRIRADIFADYGFASIPDGLSNNSNGIFTSVGTELILDTKWFNLASIPLGIRFSWLLTRDTEEPLRKTRVEFVIPIIRI